jgi:nicotinic acid mononucleotide adenylyltransferase
MKLNLLIRNFRTLLFLQLIVQMQNKLSDDSSSNILNNTDHILSFVKHALESTPSREQAAVSEAKAHSYSGKTLETLRIIEESKDEIGADSDDEEEEDWAGTEMTTTAVNLLLAILESMAYVPNILLYLTPHFI